MSVYSIARQLKIAGVVVKAHIDPTQVSPRIKKMTQDMFRKGQLKGGWNSKSMQLANQLLRGHNLPVLNGWDTMFRCHTLTEAQIAQFDEMFEADYALEMMRVGDKGADPQNWYRRRASENLQENKEGIRKLTPKHLISFYPRFDSQDLRAEFYDKLLPLRLPEDVAALHALADRLDDPTPIPMLLEIY